MTKIVRIENADTSSYKVVVQVWERALTPGQPDRMVEEHVLAGPTELREFGIYESRYLVVKEAM